MKGLYSNLSNKTLLIVAENFGLNFSGGSRATAMVAEYFERVFSQIKVLCLKEGKHNLKNAEIVLYTNFSELPQLIQTHSNDKTIGFGDFYIAHPLTGSGIPYFFTYHDNWPEMKNFSSLSKEANSEIIDTYGKVFANAAHVFSVTDDKLPFIQKYTTRTSVVRNGLSHAVTKKKQKTTKKGTLRILMAGNIDQRKYSKAVEVFSEIERIGSKGIQVDILGNVNEMSLENKLNQFDFVNCKGFIDEVRYDDYDLYLNTSLIENLSLSVVDALANKTPVVSFDIGGIKEVVNDNNGRIINTFDTKEMAVILVGLALDFPKFNFNSARLSNFRWGKSAHEMMKLMSLI